MQPELRHQLKLLGRMSTELNLELLERVESLEHLSNQHDILLIGLMNTITRSYGRSTSTGNSEETT